MEEVDRLTAVFVESTPNTILSWMFVSILDSSALSGVVLGRYEAVLFGLVTIAIILLPAINEY